MYLVGGVLELNVWFVIKTTKSMNTDATGLWL